MKRCPRCATPLNTKATSCSKCGFRFKGGRFAAKPRKKRKTTLLLLSFSILMVCLALFGVYQILPEKKTEKDFITHLQAEIDNGCVITQQHSTVMHDDINGYCELEVSVPDYSQIFYDAFDTTDPEGYVFDILNNKKYTTVDRTVTAKVSIENGIEVVHTDEAITALLDEELSRAISTLMEVHE